MDCRDTAGSSCPYDRMVQCTGWCPDAGEMPDSDSIGNKAGRK